MTKEHKAWIALNKEIKRLSQYAGNKSRLGYAKELIDRIWGNIDGSADRVYNE